MRQAMATAEVGDDVFGDDPSVNALETETARLLGKEVALFVPSGTMANQIALLCHTERGDEVLAGKGTHCFFYESGAAAAWSGVQPEILGEHGTFIADDVRRHTKAPTVYHPRTRLVVVENTHNRGGGKVFPQTDILAIADAARELALRMHLDGARLWNAAIATAQAEATLCEPFDTVSVCFSKGLGAPVGSALAGNRETILRARRFRKMLGGGMRQAGILAAGALHALRNHRARLADDHARARALSEQVKSIPGFTVLPVETNIVIFDIRSGTAQEFVAACEQAGVRLSDFGPQRVRAVTHMDVDDRGIEQAGLVIADVAARLSR